MDAFPTVLRASKILLSGPITEADWTARKDCCNNLSDLFTKGLPVPPNFPEQIEPYFNGLFECATCERTTLCNAALKTLGHVAKLLGKDIIPHLDRFLPPLLRLCAATKPMTSTSAAATVTTIVENATYHQRLLYHICHTFEEVPVGPKRHACSWLQTILKSYHKSINTDREYQIISRAISRALEDADPATRTNSRATYWTYKKLDAVGADAIMDKLNKQAKTALQNDPHNPDKKASSKTSNEPPRPKSALAQMKAEAKKKRAAEEAQQQKLTKPERLPDRPLERDQEKPTVGAVEQDILDPPKAPSRLLSAPVRRPRVMATPLPTPSARPPKHAEAKPDTLRSVVATQASSVGETLEDPVISSSSQVPGEQVKTDPRITSQDDIELVKGRTLIETLTRQLRNKQLDVLGFKKLKAIVERYASNLFLHETQYDDLVEVIIDDLQVLNSPVGAQAITTQLDYNSLYMQKAALQILIPLFDQHRQWGSKWVVSFTLWALAFRSSLVEGPKDLRIIYTDKLIQVIVSTTVQLSALLDAIIAIAEPSEPQLDSLTLIMQRMRAEQLSLDAIKAGTLCNLVTQGLRSALKVKSALVPYIRSLYILMNDDNIFFSHFTDDAEMNLLEYYLADLRPRWA